ncbi:MAG: AbrB/MazE/SpoVT family DNA-binding domain-containing protein [Acidobacteriia bacterium]|nr:AbrB/MazE/SpoVT family DNA-binding domain-containing protein [Terriglobia bacterium]
MKRLAQSTLTSKEQITIPKVVCQLLGIHAGDRLVWSRDAVGRLIVSRRHPPTLADIRVAVVAAGRMKSTVGVTVKDMRAGIAAAIRRKHGRG